MHFKAALFIQVMIFSIQLQTGICQHIDQAAEYHETIPEFLNFKKEICDRISPNKKTTDYQATTPIPKVKHVASDNFFDPWPLGLGGHYYGAPEYKHTVNYMELAFVNMAYGFSTDNFMWFLPDDNKALLNTKRILDLMATITKYTCGLNILPPEYINSAKNLFTWYLMEIGQGKLQTYLDPDNERHDPETAYEHEHRRAKRGVTHHQNAIHDVPFFANAFIQTHTANNDNKSRATVNNTEWAEIRFRLKQCLDGFAGDEEREFTLHTSCGHVTGYSGYLDLEEIPLMPPYERADYMNHQTNTTYGEEVIEAIWWMFSITFARCYAQSYPYEAWVLTFKQKFFEDLLNQFIPRWQYPGMITESFALVFGNYDVRVARRNLRYCAHAAYAFEGIESRSLVRPWKVKTDDHGEETVENYKIEGKVYSSLF